MGPEKIAIVTQLVPLIGVVTLIAVSGWVLTTWLRIRHGYPLRRHPGPGGMHKNLFPIMSHFLGAENPDQDNAGKSRMDEVCAENRDLKEHIGRLEDRLKVLERIATDPAERTAREIESLR